MKKILLICLTFFTLMLSTELSWAASTYDWVGGTSTDWKDGTNWKIGSTVQTLANFPGSAANDVARIGFVSGTINNWPVLSGTLANSITSITIDVLGGTSPLLTVNGVVLTVAGDITCQTATTFAATFTGTGTISAVNLNAITTSNANSTNTSTLDASITTLTLSGNLAITTAYRSSPGRAHDIQVNFTGTTLSLAAVQTNHANTGNTAIISFGSTTTNFSGAAAFGSLNSGGINGTNTINNLGSSTIGYTGSPTQTVYTSATTPSISYTNLTLSGTGTKLASSGNLNVSGDFSDAGNKLNVTTSSIPVVFNGSGAQAITVGGTTFKNVTFSGTGVKTVSGTMNVTGSFTNSLANDASNKLDFTTNTTAVVFNASGAQAIAIGSGLGITFKDVTFSGTGIKTVSGSPMNITGNFTNSLANDASNKPDFTTNSTAVVFNASGAQTVSVGSGLGTTFKDVTFSGTGIKTISAGIMNIAGNFTNSLTTSGSDKLDVITNLTTVSFNGAAQNIAGGGGTGTDFKDVTIGGSGTKTITSGIVNIISTGVLTLSGGSLASGGFLTLKSDVNGTASVAQITSGSVTNNVNVETYLSGGTGWRGWRLLSSPVAASSSSAITPNLTYVHAKAYTTGTTGTGGGFDATGNPTFYFYRENMAPNFTSFITGNFRGVNNISATSTFSFDGGDANATLPVGNGFLFFFRGDRTTVNPTTTTTTPITTTLTATGYLNQGNITVKPWFTGASTLSYTVGTPTSVRGFNLVGNPYASSINWDAAGITKTAISNTIWIYNPKLKVYSTYVGGSSGVGTNFNGTSGSANIIPPGQGFFVQASSTSAALTFTESSKVSTKVVSTNLLLAATNPAPITYLRLVLLKDSLNKEDALIFFNSAASPNYVQDEDADYFIGESIVHIYSKSADNHNLAINQMPFSLTRQQIPLNVIISKTGTYQLDLSEAKNIPSRYKIFLADAYKKDSVDIKKQPIYTFTADTTNANTFGSSRFYLVINQNDSSAYKLTDLVAVKSISGASVIWKTINESNNLTFTVERSNDGGLSYSLLGSMGSSGLGTYSFVDKSPQAGINIYRLKQQDNFGGLSYTQVSLDYSAAGSTNSVGVYPNPATANIKLAVTEISKAIADNTLPDYTIAISNNTGSIVKSITTSKPAGWQGDVSTYAPGMYFLRVINNNTKTVVGSSKFVKL